MKAKATLLLFLFFSTLSFSMHAQQKADIGLIVRDKISNRSLGSVRVSVLGADSTFIDTCQAWKVGTASNFYHEYAQDVTSSQPYYLLKLERKGYQTRYIRVENKKDAWLGDVFMERQIRERKLGEATVTASKVMMVMKGDTIVYNADAFELGEGSMLDQLISCLPGVKLEPGGVITINGNRVNSLLINGKDFFNGDPNVALENLPAYTVDKIKAYQKAPEDAFITRRSEKARQNDPWVIDVNLKKDYNQGLLATAEAGGGTNDRFLGKLFAMRFTDQTNLFVFANANNLNDQTKPGQDGSWANYDNPARGQVRQQQGGFDFTLTGKNQSNRFNTSIKASRTTTNEDTRSSSVNYNTTGDTYGRSQNINNTDQKGFNWYTMAALKGKKAYFSWQQGLDYSTTNSRSDLRSATFYQHPAETSPFAMLDSVFHFQNYNQYAPIVNSVRDRGLSETRQWVLYENIYSSIRLPNDKSIGVILNGSYNHAKATRFSQYQLHTPKDLETPNDFRNRYLEQPDKFGQFLAILNYTLFDREKNGWNQSLPLAYYFDFKRKNSNSTLHRLDQLGNEWSGSEENNFGRLPSTTDSLAQCIDWMNTFHTKTTQIDHTITATYTLLNDSWQIYFQLPVKFEHNTANDLRKEYVYNHASKSDVFFNPNFNMQGKGWNVSLKLNHESPDIKLLLPVCDNSNPLAIWTGNPNLKSSTRYQLKAKWQMRSKRKRDFFIAYDFQSTHNAIGQTRLYNAETGATTFSPANINGNWQTSVSTNFAGTIDKKQHWAVILDAGSRYFNSVDFEQNVLVADQAFSKSTVRNLYTTASAQLRFKSKPFNAAFKADFDWRHATSQRQGFETINSVNILYCLTTLAKLPWNVELNSDLTLYTRHGYADHTMNRNEWIWNASLEKRFLRNKALALKCTAFDLLAQRRNVERDINAQGYTETWYNTLPRYVIFTLSYRFHKAPKRSYD